MRHLRLLELLHSRKAPAILTPERDITVESSIMLQGIIDVELVHASTGLIKQKLRFNNLIVDAGMDAIGVGSAGGVSDLTTWCGVGTGNTPPDASDTSLESQLGNRTDNNGGIADQSVSGPDNDYHDRIRTRVFTEEQVNGNLTEVAFFNASTSGTMFMRQLFLDGGGNPTTIVKTNQDQLRITYTFRVYTLKSTINQQIDVGGVLTDVNSRGQNIQFWGIAAQNIGRWTEFAALGRARAVESNTLPSLTSGFPGTQVSDSSHTYFSYNNGNFYRELRCIWEPGIANFATGIGGIAHWNINTTGDTQHIATVFNPKLPKDDTKRLVFNVRHKWARVT